MRSSSDFQVGQIFPRDPDSWEDDARRASHQPTPAWLEWTVTASYPLAVMSACVGESGRDSDNVGTGDGAWGLGEIGRPTTTVPATRRLEIGKATIVLGCPLSSRKLARTERDLSDGFCVFSVVPTRFERPAAEAYTCS